MRNRLAFIVGMSFLALPGCLFVHGGYPPYRYYGPGPSVLPSQPWTGYPNGPVYQPGNPVYPPVMPNQPGTYPTPLGGGNPYLPQGTPGSTGDPGSTGSPTYADPPGGSTGAPKFDSTPAGNVPDPSDDFNRQPGAQRPPLTPTSDAKASNELSTPFGEQNSTRRPRNFDDPPVVEADTPFETPVIQTSNIEASDVRYANQQAEPVQVSNKKFANHPRFEWVQGLVEYDDPSSTWVIMYNDNPRASDVYGGELTLADDPALARMQSGDVVRIYGTLDPVERDSRGKPLYQATRIEPRNPAAR